MKNPTVSVIIPTYNRSYLISRAIRSVLNQTYQDFEIIIVDDGSTDNTNNIIKKFQQKDDRIIYFKHNNNEGGPAARNIGLKVAKGQYIQFLDSDDYITSEKIKIQIDAMKKEGTPCAICDFQYVDSNGNVLQSVENNGNIHSYIAKFRSPCIMPPLIRKTSIISGLKWGIELKRNQDMDFMFKYFITIRHWSYTPGFFCKYVLHKGDQISNRYHLGVQCLKLYKSMYSFVYKNIGKIPQDNLWVLKRYRNKLFKIFLRQSLRKLLQKIRIWGLFNNLRSSILKKYGKV